VEALSATQLRAAQLRTAPVFLMTEFTKHPELGRFLEEDFDVFFPVRARPRQPAVYRPCALQLLFQPRRRIPWRALVEVPVNRSLVFVTAATSQPHVWTTSESHQSRMRTPASRGNWIMLCGGVEFCDFSSLEQTDALPPIQKGKIGQK
jgi:hypothetical protein